MRWRLEAMLSNIDLDRLGKVSAHPDNKIVGQPSISLRSDRRRPDWVGKVRVVRKTWNDMPVDVRERCAKTGKIYLLGTKQSTQSSLDGK